MRRTEYISSNAGGMRFESSTSKEVTRSRNDPKRARKTAVDKENPLNILRNVIRGFDLAYPQDVYTGEETEQRIRGAEVSIEDKRAWSKPRHPTKSNLELLDSYPVLPDLDAFPGIGSYIMTKFSTNPLGTTDGHDRRLDTAILLPVVEEHYQEKLEERMAAYNSDLSLPKPTPEYDYQLYVADAPETVRGIKRKFDFDDPDHDDPALYNHVDDEGNGHFKFNRIRAYETYQQAGDQDDPFGDTLAVALHDPSQSGKGRDLKKGAYFYPILQRTSLRPKRKPKQGVSQLEEDQVVIDALEVTVRDSNEMELSKRSDVKAKFDSSIRVEEANAEVTAEA